MGLFTKGIDLGAILVDTSSEAEANADAAEASIPVLTAAIADAKVVANAEARKADAAQRALAILVEGGVIVPE